jgi:hypothetical protein
VTIDDTGFVKTEVLPELVARQRKLLADMATSAVDPMGDLEPWETKALMVTEYERQLAGLGPRIAEADRRYVAMLARDGRALAARRVLRGSAVISQARQAVSMSEATTMLSIAMAALFLTRGIGRPKRNGN